MFVKYLIITRGWVDHDHPRDPSLGSKPFGDDQRFQSFAVRLVSIGPGVRPKHCIHDFDLREHPHPHSCQHHGSNAHDHAAKFASVGSLPAVSRLDEMSVTIGTAKSMTAIASRIST